MMCEVINHKKSIVISGILLVLLSACCGFNWFYKGDTILTKAYVIRMTVRIVVGIVTFILSFKYGRKFMLKYGWTLIPIGLAATLLSDNGYIHIFHRGIDIAPFINMFVVAGLASYFYQYGVKSILHNMLFWISGFLFLLAAEEESFVIILTVMIGMMLASAYKNKLIKKKSAMMLNLVLYAVLFAWSVKITVLGIVELKNLFYDTGYMASISRQIFANLKIFGTAESALPFAGNIDDFKLLWIFGVNGIAAGAVVSISLTAFIFFVCKKSFKIIFTDATPLAYATASILLVRYVISMLTHFGIVLGSLYAPVPLLSDGTLGYIAIFMLIGMIVGDEKLDMHSNRFGFV